MPTTQQLQYNHEMAGLTAQTYASWYSDEFSRIVTILISGGAIPDLTYLKKMADTRDHYALVSQLQTAAYLR